MEGLTQSCGTAVPTRESRVSPTSLPPCRAPAGGHSLHRPDGWRCFRLGQARRTMDRSPQREGLSLEGLPLEGLSLEDRRGQPIYPNRMKLGSSSPGLWDEQVS